MSRYGFTLIELLVSIGLLAFGTVAALKVFTTDLTLLSQEQVALLSQSVARDQTEKLVVLGGYDVVAELPPESGFTHPLLASIPCAYGQQYTEAYTIPKSETAVLVPNMLKYSAVVRAASACDKEGNPLSSARMRKWQVTTIVAKDGFDKTRRIE
jgi:prepilin-type N-terminal cleavage/methylation domain-containing protein